MSKVRKIADISAFSDSSSTLGYMHDTERKIRLRMTSTRITRPQMGVPTTVIAPETSISAKEKWTIILPTAEVSNGYRTKIWKKSMPSKTVRPTSWVQSFFT
jgi:hypothetical protein